MPHTPPAEPATAAGLTADEVASHQGRAVVLDEDTKTALATGGDLELAAALAERLDLGLVHLESLARRPEGQVSAALCSDTQLPRHLRRSLLGGRTPDGELIGPWPVWRIAGHDRDVAGAGANPRAVLAAEACCTRTWLERGAAALGAVALQLAAGCGERAELVAIVDDMAHGAVWRLVDDQLADLQDLVQRVERSCRVDGRRAQAVAAVEQAAAHLRGAAAAATRCSARCGAPTGAVADLRRAAAGAWAAAGSGATDTWAVALAEMDPDVVAGLPAAALAEVCRTAPQELGWPVLSAIIEQRGDVSLGWGAAVAAWVAGRTVPLRRLRVVAHEVRLVPLVEAVTPAGPAAGLARRHPVLGDVLDAELARVAGGVEHRRCFDALLGEFEGTLAELVAVSARLAGQGRGHTQQELLRCAGIGLTGRVPVRR